jgi:TIR domain/PAN domain
MGAIFINYRREDSNSTAGRLHDRLALAFGRETIFMDIDHIPAGVDFVEYLNSKLAACKVLLVVIGPNWLNAKDEAGQRRLDKPDDYVAIEIEAALVRDIRVIPILVDGAAIPKPSELPDSLKRLARRQGVEVRHNHFGRDVDALIGKVSDALGSAAWRRPWRWMAAASATAALLLAGSMALFWFRAWPSVKTMAPQEIQADAKRTMEEAEQQRVLASKAEEQRKAKADAEAEAQRRSQEAEQQRLAAAKAMEERKTAQQAGSVWVDHQIIKNLAVNGNDYRRITDTTIESCSTVCVGEAQCKMFSYWPPKICYLFNSEFETRSTQAAAQVGFVRVSPKQPAQEAQQGDSRAADLQIVKNLAVDGIEYKQIPASTIDSCSRTCAEEAQCKMFSYWPSKICYLFNNEFGTRSTLSDAQVGFVRVSPKQAAKQQSPAGDVSIVNNVAVKGEYYTKKPLMTIEGCSNTCVEDAQCKMFAYWQGGDCYLFDKNLGTYEHDTSQVGRVR